MTTRTTTKLGKKAIVIGGSIAGILTAKVLSDFFHEVVMIEKDIALDYPTIRKGVPQGAHGHALLKSGEEILEKLFPGFIEELLAAGSVASDFSQDISWYHHGSWKVSHYSGIRTVQQSRPFLEYHLQRRLKMIQNIQYIDGAKVLQLLTTENHSKVSGVVYQDLEGIVTELEAEVVVDSSGAASLTPQWLSKLGLPSPEKTEVKVDLHYASRIYQSLSPIENKWKGLLVYPNPPKQTFGGGIYRIEDNKWMVTLFGYGMEKPVTTAESFLEHAASLDHLPIYEAIKNGIPASDVSVYQFPKLRRFHYEKHRQLPNGLVVIGDAFCRIDPVFAQGMSLSALEASALQSVLVQCQQNQSLNNISKMAHRGFSKVLMVPWLIALVEDFRFVHTRGKKLFGLSVIQSFIKKVVLACAHDKQVYEQFISVLHLKAHPVTLFSPKVLKAIWLKSSVKEE
ncbi:FAD-dependent oxidoreductase [Mesobacillus maritimus]|uniref:FAD-binding domain protein n=1 Tax=Mesobacillus maritimus TaxID=1643336 RepID=A0ABS7K0R3_9BACI|nr:FAD-binding domain protein [Mesobacillus maritimus]MBY0095844.1 FAD-binding domain protein [Mesobacillus maritimus]